MPSAKINKNIVVGARLPIGDARRLEEIAKADDRTVSSLVRRVLAEYLRKRRT